MVIVEMLLEVSLYISTDWKITFDPLQPQKDYGNLDWWMRLRILEGRIFLIKSQTLYGIVLGKILQRIWHATMGITFYEGPKRLYDWTLQLSNGFTKTMALLATGRKIRKRGECERICNFYYSRALTARAAVKAPRLEPISAVCTSTSLIPTSGDLRIRTKWTSHSATHRVLFSLVTLDLGYTLFPRWCTEHGVVKR